MQSHELAECFPLIAGNEFAELVASIRARGQHEPITLFNGLILDGRNRYRACLEAGVEPRTTAFSGTFDDARKFVIDANIHRRHLDTSQRAMAAARLATLGHGGDRKSDQAANLPVETQAEAAKLLNVSERSVRDGRKVLDHGQPELVQAVDRGEIAVSKAREIAELPPEEQAEAVKPRSADQPKASKGDPRAANERKAADMIVRYLPAKMVEPLLRLMEDSRPGQLRGAVRQAVERSRKQPADAIKAVVADLVEQTAPAAEPAPTSPARPVIRELLATESEPSEIERKMALAETEEVGESLADGRRLAEHSSAPRPSLTPPPKDADAEVERLKAEYLANGGPVTKLPPSKRRKAA
jgi:ParB-like chromosome segregation protein Spo0J